MEYTYKILKVDKPINLMEVQFSAEGFPDLLCGMPIPGEGQSLDMAIRAYSPVPKWLDSIKVLANVTVGTTGTLTHDLPQNNTMPIDTAEMWAAVKFEQDVAKVLVKFGVLKEDPTIIGVTKL